MQFHSTSSWEKRMDFFLNVSLELKAQNTGCIFISVPKIDKDHTLSL